MPDTKNDRASVLRTLKQHALNTLDRPDFNYSAVKTGHEYARENLKYAEYSLENLAKGKTPESEAKNFIKMSKEERYKQYRIVLEKGGQKAVDELTSAVRRSMQRSQGIEM